MSASQVNTLLAKQVLFSLYSSGVEEYCICPASRNAPFLAVLIANPGLFRVFYFFEERSAAFFALGRMKLIGKSVAVITTSGTAAGELLPATMEAYYSGLPLVLLTADRPKKYRGSGAPQAAEQVGLLGIYASRTYDLEAPGDQLMALDLGSHRPVHVNVCFDEPLLEPELTSQGIQSPYEGTPFWPVEKAVAGPFATFQSFSRLEIRTKLQNFFKESKSPIVLVGSLHLSDREAVAQLLLRWEIPSHFEGLSGLREDKRLEGIRVHAGDSALERAAQGDFRVDGLLRMGGVPTSRLWRDFETKYSKLPVLSMSTLEFTGLGRPSELIYGSLDLICREIQNHLNEDSTECTPFRAVDSRTGQRFLELDRTHRQHLDQLLREEPDSEPGMVAALTRQIPRGSRIYLGNSLPIREWDLAASIEDRKFEIGASRGLNGIDGQVSTFLGFSSPHHQNWAILGDLTALYDLPGPWILSQMKETHTNLVVINNGGGKIFSRMYPQPEFQNQHGLRFRSWAELWGLNYQCWLQVPDSLVSQSPRHQMIELLPNEEATRRFWIEYQKLG